MNLREFIDLCILGLSSTVEITLYTYRVLWPVQRNQEHESDDPNRDKDVHEIITKSDFPRKPAATSNIKQKHRTRQKRTPIENGWDTTT